MERRGSLMSASSAEPIDLSNPNPNYLTIVALEDGLTASLSTNAVEYSIDGNDNWTTLTAGATSPTINTGQYISFRGNLTPGSYKGVGTFTINKSCDLTGNCNSLLFGDDAKSNNSLSGKNYAFRYLFQNCTTIRNVSSNFLPATTLAPSCYNRMFYNCSKLTTAPELPAATLTQSCYQSMFNGCTSLTTAPELPATTLARYCYDSMFYGTNVLPDCSNIDFSSSTVVASRGLSGLFAGTKVTDSDLRNILPINSNGKYYLPCTKLKGYCYYSMFSDCTSLTTAPELPAATLVGDCYNTMFYGCSKLNYIKAMFTTTPSSSYTFNWVSGVASSGTFVKNKNATWNVTNVTGEDGIPSGWEVQTA